MKKWLPFLGEYAIGILVFLVYTGGFLFISLTYLKNSLEEFGRNTELNDILFFFLVIIFSIILIPVGNIYFYKQFKRSGLSKIADGIVIGLSLTILIPVVYLAGNDLWRLRSNRIYNKYKTELPVAPVPFSPESLDVRNRQKTLLEWENYNKKEYSRNDSLKNVKDSLQNEKDWQKVL